MMRRIEKIVELLGAILQSHKASEARLCDMNKRLDDLTSSLIGIKAGEIAVQDEMRKFFKVEREIREREGNTVIEKPTADDLRF